MLNYLLEYQEELKLVKLYSTTLLILIVLAIGGVLLYYFLSKEQKNTYVKSNVENNNNAFFDNLDENINTIQQVPTPSEDDWEIEDPKDYKKHWINLVCYFLIFNFVGQFIAGIFVGIYLGSQGITNLDDLPMDSLYYSTSLNIANLVTYIVTMIPVVLISFKFIIKDSIKFYSKIKFYLKWVGYGVLLMFGLNLVCNMIVGVFTNGLNGAGESTNQAMIVKIITSSSLNTVLMMITTVIFAPILEELVFRKALFGIFIKKTIFTVIFSAVIFASIHVIPACIDIIIDMNDGTKTVVDLYLEGINLISYLGQAFAITFVYYKTKGNIIPCILIHFINNLLATVLIFVA